MQANSVALLGTEAISQLVASTDNGNDKNAISEEAQKETLIKEFASIFSGNSDKKIQISNKSAIAFLAEKTTALQNFARRLVKHTDRMSVVSGKSVA